MLRNAVDDDLISKTPCKVIGAATEHAAERPIATVAEIEALSNAMPDHLRLLVELAAWCQLRRGELLGLKRRDIDLMHATMRIERSRNFRRDGSSINKATENKVGESNSFDSPKCFAISSRCIWMNTQIQRKERFCSLREPGLPLPLPISNVLGRMHV